VFFDYLDAPKYLEYLGPDQTMRCLYKRGLMDDAERLIGTATALIAIGAMGARRRHREAKPSRLYLSLRNPE
jgi:hypothetical protein